MSPAEFAEQFERLTAHFHLPTDGTRDTLAVDWLKALQHYHVDAFEHAVTQLTQTSTDRFWPALGRVLEVIKTRISRYDKFNGKCEGCGGSGWVEAPPFESNGLIYGNTVQRCLKCGIPEPQIESHRRRSITSVQAHEYQAGRFGRDQMPAGLEAKHPEKPGNPELRHMIAAFRAKFANSGEDLA
jgi:hypothetical protein